jgi:carboxyl-terminal processing protease
MTARNLAGFLVVMLTAAAAYAETPSPKSAADAAARRAWAITDVVLEQDIDPPARQQMLLHGLQALLRQTPGRTTPNLAARVSAVTTPEQFAALLSEVWPTDEKGTKIKGEEREHLLFHGLFGWRQSEDKDGSHYLSPRERKDYEVFAGNRYVGTGIQIRKNAKEKLTQIVIPFPGGPARKAGARPGDLIVAVDDESMEGRSLVEVVKRLQGEEGTRVSMTVRQPGESKTRRLPMVRSIIPFSSVHGYRRTGEESWSFRPGEESAVGYLTLDDIKSSTLLELRKIEPLVRDEGVRAVVFDLRFAAGREIRHTALVADGLLDGGILWRVRDARGRVKEYKADRDCLFRDMPMVVLVGEHTRRMAAVLAAALQDRGRAILVGEPTRARLVATSLVPLPDGEDALLLWTGKVERVGRADKSAKADEMQRLALAAGVVMPDHRVAIERRQMEAVMEWRQQQQSPEPKGDVKAPADPQLDKAIALLGEILAQREKKSEP